MLLFEYLVGPVVITVIVGVFAALWVYWYLTKNFDFWKVRGVPYKEPIFFLGSNLDFFQKDIHECVIDRYNTYGSVYGAFEGHKPSIAVGDPELLRDILVKDFHIFIGHRPFSTNDDVLDKMLQVLMSDDWKRVRSILSPTFSTGKLKRVFGIFKDCSLTLAQNFRDAAIKNEAVDVKKIYGAYTVDIIANSAFSMKIDSHNDPENEFVRKARDVFSPNLRWRFLMTFMFPRLMKLFGITMLPKDETAFFKKVVIQVIEERRKSGEVRNDFLQLLMDATKEIEDDSKLEKSNPTKDGDDLLSNYGSDTTNHHIFKPFANKRLSMDELVAQCVNFFMVGYETTASTLAFASFLLALNQDAQDRLRQEVDDALEATGGEFSYEMVQNLKYLDNVISETLRIYPPVVGIERVAGEDYKLGETGITIPKGMVVQIPIYAMHRDPKIFPDPEKFEPDRFILEERSKRSQYSYMPFSTGPRNCIGMRFALMEIKVCLAIVVSNFVLKRSHKTKVPMEFYPGMGLLQPKEIYLEAEIRG